MPFILPFLPAIIGGASALAGGLVQNSKSGRTATSEFSRSGTSTTEGHLGRKQMRLRRADLDALLKLIQAGPNILQADKDIAYGDINRMYNAVIPRLQANFTARGMGSSGAFGKELLSNEYNRANARQQATAGLQHDAMQRFLQTIGLSNQFLTPLSTTTTTQESGTGSQMGPSQLGNTIAGLGGNIAQALWLSKLLGGSRGAGAPNPDDFDVGSILDSLGG